MKISLRLGTRGSPLALTQANMVADALRAAHGWEKDAIEIVPINTSGDRIRSPVAALACIAGEGVLLRAEILSPEGDECITGETAGDPAELARDLLARASPGLRALFGV